MNIEEKFENGNIYTTLFSKEASSAKFTPHNTFAGVYLKHLVTGEITAGAISCHLVKIDPYCKLDLHIHADNLEIHEVISGFGECSIGDKKAIYEAGNIGVIPKNVEHSVTAGEEGLYILATFNPALC